MFVTREERQPLGGFFTFILPMCLFGILALGPQRFDLTLGAVSLLYLWRANRPVSSVIGAAVVTALVAAAFYLLDLTPLDRSSGIVFSSWICLLVLAGAATDDPDSKLELPPAWRHIFPRLISLPLMLIVVIVFVALFSVMGAAIFRVGSSFTALDTGTFLQSLFVTSSMQTPMYLAAVGAFLGLVVAVIRYQRALVGSVRYAILLTSRYLLPVFCVIAFTLFLTMFWNANYTDETRSGAYMTMAVILLVSAALVHADGSLPKPPLWISLPVLATILLLPLLLWLPVTSVLRLLASGEVDADNISTLVYLGLIAVAALMLAIGAVSDLIVGSERWMPALAPLMVGLVVLIGFLPLLVGVTLRLTGA